MKMLNKKDYIFLIMFLVLIVPILEMVSYQKELKIRIEERIADIAREQIESRRQTEELINQKIVDSENRQMQYYKGLEDSFIKETENRRQFEDYAAKEIESRKKLESSLIKEIEFYKQKQQEYGQGAAD